MLATISFLLTISACALRTTGGCQDKSKIKIDDGTSITSYDCLGVMRKYSPATVCRHDVLGSSCCKSCADFAANPCMLGDAPSVKIDGNAWNCSQAIQILGESWVCSHEYLSSACCQSCASYDPNQCKDDININLNGVDYKDCASLIYDYGMTQVCDNGPLFLGWCCQSCKAYDPDACVDEPRFYYHKSIGCPEAQYWYGTAMCNSDLLSQTCCATCADVAASTLR